MLREVSGIVLFLAATSSVSAGLRHTGWVRDLASVWELERPWFEERDYLHHSGDLPGTDNGRMRLRRGSRLTEEQLEIVKGVIRDDFLVNDDTTGGCLQWYPSVSMDGTGGYVVAWEDCRNGDWDIYAQRYDSLGNPQGPNFRVNEDVAVTSQRSPSIAAGVPIGFVVTWSDERSGNGDVYAQRYDSSGNPQGPNFRVNDDVGAATQGSPSVAMHGTAGFVISWLDGRNGDSDIYAQRYDSSGVPQGSNFRVNDDAGTAGQLYPSVTMDGSARFVVAWRDQRNVYSDIYAQRYDSSGNPQGPNFRVNDDTGSALQVYPSVSASEAGGFVVAWQDDRHGDWDIYAQRYDLLGNPQGPNFLVNDDAISVVQLRPSAAMDSGGRFVITWEDPRNGDYDICAQRYDSLGMAQGSNFRVNDDPGQMAWQQFPSVAADGDGDFVVAWADDRDDYDYNIYIQSYDRSGSPQGSNSKVNDDVGSSIQEDPSTAMDGSGSCVVAWTDARNAHFDIYGQRFDDYGSPQGSNFRVNDHTGWTYQWDPSVGMSSLGNFVIAWTDSRSGIRDIYAQRYDSSGVPQGSNLRVNDDPDSAYQGYPSVATDGTGRLVIVWQDSRSGFHNDIYAQRYDSSGTPQGPNFRVNDDPTWGYQGRPSVAVDGAGGFVVAWEDDRLFDHDIYAQRYDSAGFPQGSNFRVNDDTDSIYQIYPSVALDAAGGFVVTWMDWRNGDWDVYAQMYDSSGNPQGSNFRVNDDVGTAEQSYPSIAMDPAGGRFVVFWTDFRNPDGDPEVVAQKYVDGAPSGPNLQINQPDSFPYNHQQSFRFSLASNTDLVAFTWLDNRRHKGWDIYAKLTDWDLVGIEEHSGEYLHTTYYLISHPNPFINRTTLKFSLTETCMANLKIYDAAGREVASLLRKKLEPGNHRMVWTPAELPSGVYFARLKSGEVSLTRKLVVLR